MSMFKKLTFNLITTIITTSKILKIYRDLSAIISVKQSYDFKNYDI